MYECFFFLVFIRFYANKIVFGLNINGRKFDTNFNTSCSYTDTERKQIIESFLFSQMTKVIIISMVKMRFSGRLIRLTAFSVNNFQTIGTIIAV